MTNLRILIRSTYLSVALGLFATIVMPISVLVSAEACVPPPDTGSGVRRPVGSDAAAFTYNCGNGMWESAHYTYNPATGLTTANDPVVYTYNSGTGMYDTTTWVYNAPANNYVPNTKSVITPPAGANVVGAPVPVAAGGNSVTNTGPNSNNTINNNGGVTNGSSINGTGPNSNNTVDGSATNTVNGTNNTNAGMANTITAVANTGNALTLGNTTAGGAASGNAQDIANVVNLLQSSSNALDGNTVTFVANIDGDVNGDLLFDPAQIGAVQPANITSPTGTNNLTLNNQLGASINNTIDLTAHSGDATVSGNTNGGDATSGTAATIANVVNLINSAISSGKSFLGVVNINGNLNGDILVPADFVEQLIASNVPTVDIIANTGPNSNNAITTNSGSNNTNVTNTNNQGITNNVNATATSGQATVAENTSGGNASTGAATTKITAFNLTGSNVIGANSILVFVNVLGSWVGLIVNAPPGATAAQLGGGITKNTTAANNNTNIDNNTNQTITNDIRTAATSGDATVSRNTKGGNATSGSAKGAVNLLNVENSSIALSNWFGILFINVFGTWHGSFGMNTSAGDPIAAAGGRGADGTPAAAAGASFAPTQFATFLPSHGNAQFRITGGANGRPTVNSSTDATDAVNAVLAASTIKGSKAPTPTLEQAQSNFRRTAAIITACCILFILGDAYRSRRAAGRKA